MNVAWSSSIPLTVRDVRTQLDCALAHTTVTTTLTRLYDQGLLTRELVAGRKMPWVYTARYASRGKLLAGAVEQLCAQLGADRGDRALALAVLLGRPRWYENVGE